MAFDEDKEVGGATVAFRSPKVDTAKSAKDIAEAKADLAKYMKLVNQGGY